MRWHTIILGSLLMAWPAQATTSVEPELCYIKIIEAYEGFSESGTFSLKDKNCEKYLETFKDKLSKITWSSDIAFIGTPIAPVDNGSRRAFATQFKVEHVYDGPDLSSITIHHAVPKFQFYPGLHLIRARRTETGLYINQWTKHGEVISDAELERREDVRELEDYIKSIAERERYRPKYRVKKIQNK